MGYWSWFARWKARHHVALGGLLAAGVAASWFSFGPRPRQQSHKADAAESTLTSIPEDVLVPDGQPVDPQLTVVETPADEVRLETPDDTVQAMSDEEIRMAIEGAWTTQVYGTQAIRIHSDGTAALHSQLDFITSLLYGSELRMKLAWVVEDGNLSQEIQSGTPTDNVRRLIQDQGAMRRYQILELDDSHMRLQDIDEPETFRVWKRVPPS